MRGWPRCIHLWITTQQPASYHNLIPGATHPPTCYLSGLDQDVPFLLQWGVDLHWRSPFSRKVPFDRLRIVLRRGWRPDRRLGTHLDVAVVIVDSYSSARARALTDGPTLHELITVPIQDSTLVITDASVTWTPRFRTRWKSESKLQIHAIFARRSSPSRTQLIQHSLTS